MERWEADFIERRKRHHMLCKVAMKTLSDSQKLRLVIAWDLKRWDKRRTDGHKDLDRIDWT